MSSQAQFINWKQLDFFEFSSLIYCEQAAFSFAKDLGLIDNEKTCECGSKISNETRWTYLAEFVFKQKSGWHSPTVGERIYLLIAKLRDIKFE
jgi:hypothetical protein